MQRSWVFIVAGLAAALSGCNEPNTFMPPPPPTVTVAQPVVETVTTFVEFTGRTEAPEFVEVRARVPGYLDRVAFAAGSKVEEGQLLFEIEPEAYETALAAARARHDSARARLSLAEATLGRTQEAADRGAATSLEVATREAERDEARAAVDEAAAAVAGAELDLSYTKVVSPIAGRASRELVTEGNLVGAGEATLLTTVVIDDPLHVYFDIDERAVLAFLKERPRADRAVTQTVPAFLTLLSGEAYEEEGVIDYVDNIVNESTGTLRARASFPNPAGRLFPGMFVRVRIPEQAAEATLVPQVAVQRDLQGPYLLVVNASDIVERRNVTTGKAVGERIIITGGVEPDARVIVAGVQRAREGAAVDPTAAPATPPTAEG
jgi:RND family efflux transporter MFP subunit